MLAIDYLHLKSRQHNDSDSSIFKQSPLLSHQHYLSHAKNRAKRCWLEKCCRQEKCCNFVPYHSSVTILICQQHPFDFLDRLVENNLIKTFVQNVLSIECIPNTQLDPFLNYLLCIEEFFKTFSI